MKNIKISCGCALYILIIIAIIFIIIVFYTYNKYNPKIDIILSNNKYVIIIWYYIKDNNGNYIRTYKKLLII